MPFCAGDMKMLGRGALLSAFLFSMSACSTLSVNVPGPLIESPELAGESGKIEFGAGLDNSTNYTYTSDASKRPPTLNSPEVKTDAKYLFARGGYSVLDWLEIGLRIFPGPSVQTIFFAGGGVTARAQLIGVGNAPGVKFALYGAALQAMMSANGDQNGTFGAGGYNWRASAKGVTTTGGASLGYRFAESNALLFIAFAYADQKVSGTIDQDLNSNGTSPAASYVLTDVRGNTRSAAIGARFGNRIQFGMEARYNMRSWPGTGVPEVRGGGESAETTYAVSLNFR